MSRMEMLKALQHLAQSQGYYGRLLNEIEQNNDLLDCLANQHFNNIVEVVMWIEG